MKAYEFQSVIETRRQVEAEFAFFREMMAEKELKRQCTDNNDGRTAKQTIRGCDFKSVREVRQQVEDDLRWFREMLNAKEARRKGIQVDTPVSRGMPLLSRIWPCWANLPKY